MIAGVWVPVALQAQLSGDGGEGLYLVWPAWVSLYALAAYGTRRQLLTGIPLALVCLAVHDLNDPLNWRTADGAWSAAWWDLVLFVPALVGGIVAGSRRTRTLATEKALVEAQARVAVAEERARIARELHDVVTHHVNLVVLQAMAASGMLDRDPEKVREPLQVIERSGREALSEMRRLLGVLRDGPPGEDGRPTQDLETLVATFQTAGLPVVIRRQGPEPRSPSLRNAIFRTVQEALTNALRYADNTRRVLVDLDYRADPMLIEVTDDGHGTGPASSVGTQQGLLALRERISLYGGTVQAGPQTGHGWAVRVTLPRPEEEADE
jgi:signal transduction histidine kinase